MKYLLGFLVFLIVSCNTYENKMNSLLSKKKLLEDSITNDIAKSENKYGRISLDSIMKIVNRNKARQEELDRVIYSIDSLSKLK